MATRKTTSLVEHRTEIEDQRRGNGKRHELVEVLVIAICAIFANVEGFQDVAVVVLISPQVVHSALFIQDKI